MSKNAEMFIAYICMQLKKENDPEKIRPEELEMTPEELILAGEELKRIGLLPNFAVTKKNNSGIRIWFIGEVSPQAMKQVDEWMK